jgi:biotin carboxyl carrier protein
LKLVALHDGNAIPVVIERQGSGYLVKIGEKSIVVDLVTAGRFVHSLRLEDGRQYSLVHHRSGNQHDLTILGHSVQVEIVDPLALKRARSEDGLASTGVVSALMPGRVVRVLVKKGDSVQRGTPLVIFEAMKMENEIQAAVDGMVDEVFVQPGQTVESGAALVHVKTD